MIYKKAEIHNVAEIKINEKDGSMTWFRMPGYLTDKFEIPMAKDMNVASTGVEIRFVIKSGTATVRMQSLSENGKNSSFHVFRGGIQGGYTDMEDVRVGAEPHDFKFEKSGNIDVLRAMSEEAGERFDPEVIRIIFDRGTYRILDISGDIEPPSKGQTPLKTLMCYGSSITHGSSALDMSHSWASMLAHELHTDLINLGMAGSCALEPEVIDYIAAEGERGAWDILIMELGANVLSWEEEKIRERTEYAFTQTALKNPDKKIYAISPLYCGLDFKGMPQAARWRRVMKETADKLSLKNLIYIDGLDLIGSLSRYISADEVHPSIYGSELIAKKLTGILKG